MKIIWVVCNLIIMSATQSILFFYHNFQNNEFIFSNHTKKIYGTLLEKMLSVNFFIQELQLRPSVNKIKYELLLFPFVGEYNYTHVTVFHGFRFLICHFLI